VSFVPSEAQISAETHSLADQMPGGTLDHEIFNQSIISLNLAWNDFRPYSSTILSDSSDHAINSAGPQLAGVWDKDCYS